MPSEKREIIERIFAARWDPGSEALSDPLVTLADISAAIRAHNAASPRRPLSDRNTANFFKDFIRKTASANDNWPPAVFARGYTARQRTGGNACFEFVRVRPDQRRPFPGIPVPAIGPETPRHRIESASLPLASRLLGRSDEPWLIQVLVRLRVVETHLALFSSRHIMQVDHLQMSLKLSEAEVDALFLALEDTGGDPQPVLVTLEAKGRTDDILEDQMLMQVRAVFSSGELVPDVVIPMAAKALVSSVVYLAEFEPIRREDAATTTSLALASDRTYELVPPVPGIGELGSARRKGELVLPRRAGPHQLELRVKGEELRVMDQE